MDYNCFTEVVLFRTCKKRTKDTKIEVKEDDAVLICVQFEMVEVLTYEQNIC